MSRLSHASAFDDAPSSREHRGNVDLIVAVVRSKNPARRRHRSEGHGSPDRELPLRRAPATHHLQGIAAAGFNVVDVFALHEATRLPILVDAAKPPITPPSAPPSKPAAPAATANGASSNALAR
jgi:hypothetical protein